MKFNKLILQWKVDYAKLTRVIGKCSWSIWLSKYNARVNRIVKQAAE